MNIHVILDQNLESENKKRFMRFFNKALIFQSNMDYEKATIYYEKAAKIDPEHLATHQVIGFLYQSLGRWTEALRHYKKAITLHKHSATLQNSAGLCEERCKNLPAAKKHYSNAIDLKENDAQAFNNLGNICRKLGEYKNSEQYLLRALKFNISVETLANLGVLMSELGNYSQSKSFYEHAIRLQPDNPQLSWNKSLLLLGEGDFDMGWHLYDQGKLAGTRKKQISPMIDNISDLSIDYFKGKSVYIRGEQGIGDEIMFASCFTEIIKTAKSCTIECDDRLVPLFQRSFPTANIVTEYDAIIGHVNMKNSDADLLISSGSIPRFLRRDFSSFQSKNPYLKSYSDATENWKKRYNTKQKPLNVGISWRGGINEESRRRSTPLLDWVDLLGTDNINFINLQYGDITQDQPIVDKYLSEWTDTNHFHNIEQLAAQISALDLVITVSNVTAHLAGALGVPVYVLLPHSPNWRWFNGKKTSPWYKSALLFPQKQVDDWSDVFTDVEAALFKFVIAKREKSKTVVDLFSST